MNDLGHGGRRHSLGYWYADNPVLDVEERPSTTPSEFPHAMETLDYRLQRHSYAGPPSSTFLEDTYIDALNSFCTYRHPGTCHRHPVAPVAPVTPVTKHPLYRHDSHTRTNTHKADNTRNVGTHANLQRHSNAHSKKNGHVHPIRTERPMRYGVWYYPPYATPSPCEVTSSHGNTSHSGSTSVGR